MSETMHNSMAVSGNFLVGEGEGPVKACLQPLEAQPVQRSWTKGLQSRLTARKRNAGIGEPVVGSPQAVSGSRLADFRFGSKKIFCFFWA